MITRNPTARAMLRAMWKKFAGKRAMAKTDNATDDDLSFYCGVRAAFIVAIRAARDAEKDGGK